MADAESKKPDARSEARRQGENFVAKLVPDPASPPDLMRLAGYRGASSQEGHVRLYGNPELSIYWDIPEGDVVYEQPVPADVDPLGAVTLWVKRDSKIVSNASQSAQGGQPMNAFTAGGGAAAPLTHTLPPSVIHNCPSQAIYCPTPSVLQHCTIVNSVLCNSPAPICYQPVSPTCPPTLPPTFPTTIPTTIQTGSPVAGGGVAGDVQAAAPQALTFGGTFGPLTHTLPPSLIHNCPSQAIYCPTPSVLQHCTIVNSVLCNSPAPICYQPASPYCPPTQPTTFPTTIPTTIQTGSPVAGGGVAGGVQAAAPQAANIGIGTMALTPTHTLQSVVAICPSQVLLQCPSVLVHCTIPHSILCNSPAPICYQPVSPYCPPTQPTIPTSIPTTIQTGSPVAGGGVAGGVQAAAPQAANIGIGTMALTPTHTLQSVVAICPSQFFCPTHAPYYCPTPSVLQICTIHNSVVCNSPAPICYQPVSPYCPTQPTIPTGPTIPTTVDPGSFAAGGVAGGVAAAPQAASVQFGPAAGGAQAQLISPAVICYRPSPFIYQCYPSWVYFQCHPTPTPICYQASPYCPTIPTLTQTVTQSIATGSPVAGGSAVQGDVQGAAAPQAFTFTPVTLPTHGTIQTLPTYTHPTFGPTYGPTFTIPTRPTITITATPVTFA